MDLKTFQTLYNLQRSKMNPPRHKVTFSLMKSKITKKREQKWGVDGNGVPILISEVNAVSKQVPNTKGKRELFQAVWLFYMGTELRSQSSEGNARKNENGQWVRHFSPNRGMSDLKGGYNSKEYHIEQKQIGELHLQSQADYANWVRSFGGIYITARTFDDIYDICQRILNNESLELYMAINTGKKKKLKGNLFDSP